jgi:hypothetical protein
MKTHIPTISLIATASIIAATIAISAFATSAFAAQGNTGQQQSQGAAQAGLVNAAVGVQAQVQNLLNHNNVCVAAVGSHC